jgi:hypothetical protein
MTAKVRSFSFVCFMLFIGHAAMAQSLAPRAYVITPTNGNAITLTWSYYDGGLNFNGTIPITGATGTYSVPILSYYHSFSLFGRSANITGFLPYGVGTFQGSLLGTHQVLYDQRCLLLSSQSATSNGKTYRFARRPLELRL